MQRRTVFFLKAGFAVACAGLLLLVFASRRETQSGFTPASPSMALGASDALRSSDRGRGESPRLATSGRRQRLRLDDSADDRRERVADEVNAALAQFNTQERLYTEWVDATFRAQPRDDDWAGQTEEAALQRLESEEGVLPVEAACRKEICRIDVNFDNPERREQVVEGLVSDEPFNTSALWYRHPGDRDNRMTIFFTRRGTKLPRPPAGGLQ